MKEIKKQIHLLMYRMPGTPIPHYELPEGYSISCYRDESDIPAWQACLTPGLRADFEDRLVREHLGSVNLTEDIFFLDYHGEHIGTATAYHVRRISEERRLKVGTREVGHGRLHMVGIRPDFRGKGLSKYLNEIICRHFDELDIPFAELTTDEGRPGALKSYIIAGFRPVMDGSEGWEERWYAIMRQFGFDHLASYTEDGRFYRELCLPEGMKD